MWWTEMLPYLPFENDGLVHVTNAVNYGSTCGTCSLEDNFASTEQVLMYAAVARVVGRPITCVECVVAWNLEVET